VASHCAKGVSAVVLLAVALAAAASPQARADSTNFCPPAPGTQMLLSPYLTSGYYCVSAKFYYLTMVEYVTSNGAGVDHCAVGKQDSDGGGSNVVPAQCGSGWAETTPCVSPRVGYAKGENRSASSHYFYGAAYYNNCYV
jgi:hypothetical protein